MSELAKDITPVSIEDELKTSYLDYAMSVIVGRALPDVRDGLKPVHRRVLFSMDQNNNTYNRPHVKSARVVGDVIGKYHPHGDLAVYDTIVRMAQPFSLRYMLVDGQGNFGSIDGDAPAAMRYTEVRMQKITQELLTDLDKETVDFSPNYDGKEMIPDVLPTKIPALLVNGSSGIAVGMATNIPPHNLNEVLDGCLAYIENEEISIDELMQYIPGPDFPTGALINGRKGIVDAYQTGRGKVYVRAKASIETTDKGREHIVVTELPYQVNKAKLIEKIAELIKDKKIEGISKIDDYSDKKGISIVIEVKRDAVAEVVLNHLYSLTQMQVTFGINMVALDNGQPKVLNLKQIIAAFIKHRREVVTRRTIFELRKARERAHILEGLLIALDHIDEVIRIIRASQTDEEAQAELMSKFKLSERQSQAILDMRLRRLTGLERDKIQSEYDDLIALIADLADILAKPERVAQIIKEELDEVKRKFGDKRRTELMVGEVLTLEDEDLIEETDVLITLSNKGYIKRLDQDEFTAQKRGGRGVQGTGVKDDDFVRELVSTSTHDHLLFFTNKGRVYRLKGYEIPEYGRTAKGLPVVNLLKLDEGESIQTIINVESERSDDAYLFFTTRAGIVKRTSVKDFANIRQNGLKALNLKDEDELINVLLTQEDTDIIIGTKLGYAVRFNQSSVRSMSRSATGVKGVNLREGDAVVGARVITDQDEVLIITEKGYGKRTVATEYPTKGRAGKGMKTAKITDKNGHLAGLLTVKGDEDLMVITDTGVMIRTNVANISQTGRSTMGVKVMRLDENAKIVTFTTVAAAEKEEVGAENETESEE